MMTVSAFTGIPASTMMRPTVASVIADIAVMASGVGTKDPSPRHWRNIEPRFTLSGHKVENSTLGGAGLSRDTPSVIPAIAKTATMLKSTRLRFFLRITSSPRAISIATSIPHMLCQS
jgi:hypothetical protein